MVPTGTPQTGAPPLPLVKPLPAAVRERWRALRGFLEGTQPRPRFKVQPAPDLMSALSSQKGSFFCWMVDEFLREFGAIFLRFSRGKKRRWRSPLWATQSFLGEISRGGRGFRTLDGEIPLQSFRGFTKTPALVASGQWQSSPRAPAAPHPVSRLQH